MSSVDTSNAERFERIGMDADAEAAAGAREGFADWLGEFFDLDPVRSSDLVLAINEALANAAEFAYHAASIPGTVDVLAEYNPGERSLTVSVNDRGEWRTPQRTEVTSRTRGRGIPLMEALSDNATIETSTEGTRVRLEWNDIHRR